eukprot:ANDGO_06528.mRNA.1 hypothetical protein DICPUDRAFT_26932
MGNSQSDSASNGSSATQTLAPLPDLSSIFEGDFTSQEGPEDAPSCPICMAEMSYPTSLDSCAHAFCLPCIHTWAGSSSSCPCCRSRFSKMTFENTEREKMHIEVPRKDFGGSSGIDLGSAQFIIHQMLLHSMRSRLSPTSPSGNASPMSAQFNGFDSIFGAGSAFGVGGLHRSDSSDSVASTADNTTSSNNINNNNNNSNSNSLPLILSFLSTTPSSSTGSIRPSAGFSIGIRLTRVRPGADSQGSATATPTGTGHGSGTGTGTPNHQRPPSHPRYSSAHAAMDGWSAGASATSLFGFLGSGGNTNLPSSPLPSTLPSAVARFASSMDAAAAAAAAASSSSSSSSASATSDEDVSSVAVSPLSTTSPVVSPLLVGSSASALSVDSESFDIDFEDILRPEVIDLTVDRSRVAEDSPRPTALAERRRRPTARALDGQERRSRSKDHPYAKDAAASGSIQRTQRRSTRSHPETPRS